MGTTVSLDEKTAVLAQLERILSSPAFRNSKRYPSLLRYVVERTLEGRTADLKERTLGVEVFGRPADYDTNADPTVRVTAGEVRNRIARYYHEPGHEKELRIELPAGSYIPEFQYPASIAEQPVIVAETPIPVAKPSRLSARLVWSVLLSGLAIGGLMFWHPWRHSGSLDRFWAPFTTTGAPVTICLSRAPNSDPRPERHPAIGWPDVSAAVRIACQIEKAGGRYQLRPDETITFEDLRRQPAVLIGAFNDVWTMRLMENLRFEPQREGNLRWILDRKNPASRAWSVDDTDGVPSVGRDYAVVSRLLSARSDQPILAVAGLTGHATGVAGEFVTDPSFREVVGRKAPAGWETRNVQVVIETEVIENHSGPARVLSVHVW